MNQATRRTVGPTPRGAEVVAEAPHGARLREVTIRSEAIGREVSFQLLTPPGFSTSATRRWPVLLLLHGADDGPSSWTRETALVERCRDLDALVVLPEAGRIGFYTDWEEPDASGSAPRWEGFHLDELFAVLETSYRAGTTRVVGGVSMGGYGAVAYAAKRPGMFAAAASYSGLLHTTRTGMPIFVAMMLAREHEHRHALWGSPHRDRASWLANDPHNLAARLRGTELYLARGDGRPAPGEEMPRGAGFLERWVAPSTESLAARLAELGIPARISRGRGGHDWSTWRRELDRSWSFLVAGLGCG
jgi:diacylglycerol O-acyltransferase / trehalose O-mycolyltransferase